MKRVEYDSLGPVVVEAERLWGPQTQRSLENFPIGEEKMPRELIRAFAVLKKAAAEANARLGVLSGEKGEAIAAVCGEILAGKLEGEFPLSVWQTGSGTQTNMNLNEVIAGRGNALAGKKLLHPNDDVNKSQSSNDTFPAAMRIAAVCALEEGLLPALKGLTAEFRALEERYPDLITLGRTHLQDAVPLRFSQMVSGWRTALEADGEAVRAGLENLRLLPLGGTAVGTGLNAPKGFDVLSAQRVTELTGFAFRTAENKFRVMSSLGDFALAHGTLKALAADLMKIANDLRWLASGPRCGLGELELPANEPGSSIMPGKVNPTQCEALTMVAVRVMGNDTAVSLAASQGNFQLNVFLPVTAYSFLQSVRLLGDAMESFRRRCVSGLKPRPEVMEEHLRRSLMNVTALSPAIGYDRAAEVAKTAYGEGITLAQAAERLGYLSQGEAEDLLDPGKMV